MRGGRGPSLIFLVLSFYILYFFCFLSCSFSCYPLFVFFPFVSLLSVPCFLLFSLSLSLSLRQTQNPFPQHPQKQTNKQTNKQHTQNNKSRAQPLLPRRTGRRGISPSGEKNLEGSVCLHKRRTLVTGPAVPAVTGDAMMGLQAPASPSGKNKPQTQTNNTNNTNKQTNNPQCPGKVVRLRLRWPGRIAAGHWGPAPAGVWRIWALPQHPCVCQRKGGWSRDLL